jgi:ABC-type multidrug transport system fused ATPase/permease subunit
MFTLLGYNASEIGLYWVELQKNVAAVRRVFFFIDYTSEVDRPAEPMAPLRKAIVFNNVGFAYPDGRIGLSEVNLQIPVGKLVAIVGPTGAGKTTLAYLLPGYLRPSSGDIHFDEQNINQVDFHHIRNQVTYVFQEHMLLSDTIRENLLLANPNASEGEMLEACRIAGAMEFIDNLSDGIDTPVGKGGDTLSVGQKQRLSIARGLVRHTPILVLDEPTAALDPQTENALMASLKKVVRARLVIVIAHRLSTIREADQIVFLEAGRVVEVGDHDTLMNDPKGRYRQFVDLQSN